MRDVIVPLVTPFNEGYSIDVPALEEHVEYLQKAGVHGVFTNATTGEFTSLNPDERKFLVEKGRELVTSAFYLMGTASSESKARGRTLRFLQASTGTSSTRWSSATAG